MKCPTVDLMKAMINQANNNRYHLQVIIARNNKKTAKVNKEHPKL